MNLSDVKKTKKASRFKLVQLGESGSGKTHRMLTAIEFGKMFVFDLDGKLQDYAESGILKDEDLANIDFFPPFTVIEMFEKLNSLL